MTSINHSWNNGTCPNQVEKSDDGTERLMRISNNEDILVLSERYRIIHPKDTYSYSLQVTLHFTVYIQGGPKKGGLKSKGTE